MRHFPILLAILAFAACVKFQAKPVRIISDPNQERQEQVGNQMEEANIEVFITDHPELDEETKKELRNGTITRHAALERTKKK